MQTHDRVEFEHLVLQYYEQLGSGKRAANALGVAPSRVYAVLHRCGRVRRDTLRPRKRAVEAAAVRACRRAGLSVKESADQLGVSVRTIQRRSPPAAGLRKQPLRKPEPRYVATGLSRLHGADVATIAAERGVSVSTIYRDLHRFHRQYPSLFKENS